MRRLGSFACTLLIVGAWLGAAQDGDWPAYGRDPGGERFSPLDSIRRENVATLQVAWTFRTGDAYEPKEGRPTAFEATPLHVDGTLYLSTPVGRVIALDPVTGQQRGHSMPGCLARKATAISRAAGCPRGGAAANAASWSRRWAGLARHGRPIQYAHVPTPLELWDVWTPIAGRPVAFEPPSATFVLDWKSIRAMRQRGIGFATVTLAAGISSTGDPELDRRLPFDEPYSIPQSTASAIRGTRAQGGRIVAVGTTVVRALEHAASGDGVVRGGDGIADQRVGPKSRLRVVDAILSGTHEPGSSHYMMLRAFLNDDALTQADGALEALGYRTHEFGDSVLIERRAGSNAVAHPVRAA